MTPAAALDRPGAAVGSVAGDGLAAALERLAGAPTLLVATDFDGTLAPIVTNSWEARAPASTIDTLARLADAPRTSVAVLTGRSVAALRSLSPMPDKAYVVGSHGAEWGDGPIAPLTTEEQAALSVALVRAGEVLAGALGAVLEPKPTGFAVHVRPMADRVLAAEVLSRVAEALAAVDGVTLLSGKEVVEASVVHSSKGAALARLRVLVGADAVLFAGDDVTDESAFAELGTGDVGIKIGPGPTLARYTVPDPAGFAAVLARLATARHRT